MANLVGKRAEAKAAFDSLVADVKDNGIKETVKERGVKGTLKAGLSQPVMTLIILVFTLGIAVLILIPIWNNITSTEDGLANQMNDRFDSLMETDVTGVEVGTPTP